MLAKVLSASPWGIDSRLVEVEVDARSGYDDRGNFIVVGLPDTAVRESKDRVQRAILNTGYDYPHALVTVNLAPADLRKEGPIFDLPIAVGLLATTGQVQAEALLRYLIVGELALDGTLRPVRGALAMAMEAKRLGLEGIIVPRENAPEAAIVEGIAVVGAENLPEAVGFLNGLVEIAPEKTNLKSMLCETGRYDLDFLEVQGQEYAKRAVLVAVAGGHNLLMSGTPGAGKTMIAKRIPTIFPPLSAEESLETTRIYSVAGKLSRGRGLVAVRPFRSPHHTVSEAGLIGGGSYPKPGEISLAHNGVLFLDELPEFNRRTLEVLRQPLEDGDVTIARAAQSLTYPARFMLVAAMNPCPCGYRGHPIRPCRCTELQVAHYRSKISGPLLDRIDIQIEVPAVNCADLRNQPAGESSRSMLDQVLKARDVQSRRYASEKLKCNARLGASGIRKYCGMTGDAEKILQSAMNNMGLSARAYGKVLKVALTIADLESSNIIRAEHLSEALQYRNLDKEDARGINGFARLTAV